MKRKKILPTWKNIDLLKKVSIDSTTTPPLWCNWEECLMIQSAVVCLVVGSIPGRNLGERNTFGGAQKTQ